MDRFHGYINPYFLDQNANEVQGFAKSLQDSVPFPQMLQHGDLDFLSLLSPQTLKEPWEELESYLSNPISVEGINQILSNQELPFSRKDMILPSSSPLRTAKRKISNLVVPEMNQEKRMKKSKPNKTFEAIDNKRINHIVDERIRRRQMGEYINSLRSLLPHYYNPREDYASIVGRGINYVKVLEQFILSLESEKRRHLEDETCIPKIEAMVIHDHVNLKVQCKKKQGQLLKGIISLENLGLTVLHLVIASLSHSSVSYSFNLKIEDGCGLASADEIMTAAHQIFDVERID